MKISILSHVTPEALNAGFNKISIYQFIPIKITAVGPDKLVGYMDVNKNHLRPGDIVNGGVYLLLIETFGSVAAYSTIDPSLANVLGIQVSANHLGTAREGDRLHVTTTAVHLGRTTQIWQIDITNQNGKAISSGRITSLVTANR